MPKIAELTSTVLELVAGELEVSRDSILSKSRRAEIVDARHMAISLLHANNVYPARIAEIFRLSPRNIHYVITSFDARLNSCRPLRRSWEAVRKRLREMDSEWLGTANKS